MRYILMSRTSISNKLILNFLVLLLLLMMIIAVIVEKIQGAAA